MRDQQSILSDIFLQPWFLSLQTAVAVRNLIPAEHRFKMRAYFDDYGCLKCGTTTVRYGSNGMCNPCAQKVKLRLLIRRETQMDKPPSGGCPLSNVPKSSGSAETAGRPDEAEKVDRDFTY
jgi:hypothetical protein